MSSYTEQKANETLTRILDSHISDFTTRADSSRKALIETLRPGIDKLPEENVIHDAKSRQAFNESSRQRRAEARAAIQSVLDELVQAETAAPSSEAVNSITLLRGRRNITEQEIRDLMSTYGDNVQAARAIADIAQEHKIHVYAPASISRRENIEALSKNIEHALSEKTPRPGLISFVKAQLDNILPPEE